MSEELIRTKSEHDDQWKWYVKMSFTLIQQVILPDYTE
jgi:hypothetical protein